MDAPRVRQRNLSAVVTQVHASAGVTRAELTRATRLNRSTIADLVGELAEVGWVDERDDAPRTGVGRPSPRVVPRDDLLVAAVNPELDAVDVGLVALGGRLVARRRVPVRSPSVEESIAIAARVTRELMSQRPTTRLVGVSAAIPGIVRRHDGWVRFAPHLGWRESAFAAPLADALEVSAWAANDAQLACRAELAFGAGVGSRDMVYLNGGPSGIGGGIVVDGRLIEGRDGHAGELGHLGVELGGPLCACGARGCLEAVIDRGRLVGMLKLEHPDDADLEAAIARSTDPKVSALLSEHFGALRAGLRSIATMLNPELIVLGGHLGALWSSRNAGEQTQVLAEALSAIATGVRIEVAALGADRLLIGAAELAWESILADPLAV